MSKTPTAYNMPRDDSPRGSAGSNEGDLSFENHDVDGDRFSTRDFGDTESKISADLEVFNELDQNPIFRQLCPKNKWEDKSTCKVCSKSFKFMTKKKNCKFCGGCICEEHGKKKRPNPENTTEYVRVCDVCDELHIQKTILGEFKEKLDKKLVALEKYEREIKEQQFKINEGQKELDDLSLKKARNDKNYSEQMNFLTKDIGKGKEETRKCEKENSEMNKELQNTQKKVEELDNELIQNEKEYEKLSKEAIELTNQIEALNQDIGQINRSIRNMEEVIAQKQANDAALQRASVNTTTTSNIATTNVTNITTTTTAAEENIVVPSYKNLESSPPPSSKEESTIAPSPSENRASMSRAIEPEDLAPEQSAKSSMIENQSKRSMAKSSMSQVPRMVKTSMIKNGGGAPAKQGNCDVGCNQF